MRLRDQLAAPPRQEKMGDVSSRPEGRARRCHDAHEIMESHQMLEADRCWGRQPRQLQREAVGSSQTWQWQMHQDSWQLRQARGGTLAQSAVARAGGT